jgi:uncharacterized cupredoxin-like copper-binding protein
MKLRFLVPALAAASIALVPAAHGVVSARPLTTDPDVLNDINVTVTDSKITLSDHTGARGEGVNFHVRNIGKRPHNFTLYAKGVALAMGNVGLATPTVKPGKTFILQIYLDYRGDFIYRSTLKTDRAKPGMHGKFTVT